MRRGPTLKTLERICFEWNEKAPEGTPVKYRITNCDWDKEWFYTKTRSEAWVLGKHSVVVLLEGVSGGYCITHVEILTKEEYSEHIKRKERFGVEL